MAILVHLQQGFEKELEALMRKLTHEGHLQDDAPTRLAVWNMIEDTAYELTRSAEEEIDDAVDDRAGDLAAEKNLEKSGEMIRLLENILSTFESEVKLARGKRKHRLQAIYDELNDLTYV